MIESSIKRIQEELGDEALVLDVGAWGMPFVRADWVLDLMPYESRGLYGRAGEGEERFTTDTWVIWDICERRPFPFEDKQFDFVICSHTLEDVRDPIWVCSELNRIGKAGYIEVPSRLEEQSYGVKGPWVGWSHHHWMVDIVPSRLIEFTFKSHVVNRKGSHFPPGWQDELTDEERVQSLWWEGSFEYAERSFNDPAEHDRYLESFVEEQLRRRPMPPIHVRARKQARKLAKKVLGPVLRRGRT